MEKIWVPVIGYEWYYEVSNTWEIFSVERVLPYGIDWKHKRLIWWKNLSFGYVDWYKRVWLSNLWKTRSYLIHRIVYCSFNRIPLDFSWFNDNCILHINDNREDCGLDNLFIGSQKDNVQDMMLKWRHIKSKWQARMKLSFSDRDTILQERMNWKTFLEIWKISAVSAPTIFRIVKWHTWTKEREILLSSEKTTD